ncbi:geranylgeranyl reductase [Methanosalsum zhilinae DSM 4017]|uniref:Geranylgeranyl reductase n=1 Tax=Methanosalsum zhilinae (strain DSM 4017 / NBRC 107636 / OCM 62 / WeN5) TaxID=679901 RepID=F7XK85_METZD|nr:geranylgeranyl reductase family protein [Methanosalsum zhilinae]AEH60550.1 geranylgeranyl reductase [Methanosalsum zhilinae DSM 4017]
MIIEDSYDIIVVGAGPAGATAATYAAKKGASVLLVDRKKDIGVPLQCGGFLPCYDVLQELVPNAEIPYTLKKYPSECVRKTTDYQRFIAPDGNSKGFEVNASVIDRRRFDKFLVEEAAKAGAKVLVGTNVTDIKGNCVEADGVFGKFSINSDVIIGADGPNTTVGKIKNMVRDHDPMEMATAIEYELTGVDVDREAVEMYFGKDYVPGGYAWIIPQERNSANIGIGIRRPMCKKGMSFRDYLNHFMYNHPVAGKKLSRGAIVSVVAGLVPVGGAVGKTAEDNILLAGDAAGQLIATNGGGIPTSMIGGKIAGETAVDSINGSSQLTEYENRWKEQMGLEIKTAVYIRKLMDNLMRSDSMMSASIRMISSEHMKAIQCGKLPESVKKTLINLNIGLK